MKESIDLVLALVMLAINIYGIAAALFNAGRSRKNENGLNTYPSGGFLNARDTDNDGGGWGGGDADSGGGD